MNAAVPVSVTYKVQYAVGTVCSNGMPSHVIQPPINLDGSSVFKSGSTVPTKFTVCGTNGTPIGTAGVVQGYGLLAAANTPNVTVNELPYSNTPDTTFRWDPTAQQWIFNQGTGKKSVDPSNGLPTLGQVGTTYYLGIQLNDGSWIYFAYTLK